MQARDSKDGGRGIWLRGLLFSVLGAPLLGAVLAAAAVMGVRSRPPPSISLVLLTAVTVSYIVSTGPALLAGILCTSLALHWQNQGLSRRLVVLRLGGVGLALGVVAAFVAASLGEGRLVGSLVYLGPGAVTGLLVGLAFPRVLWGANRP